MDELKYDTLALYTLARRGRGGRPRRLVHVVVPVLRPCENMVGVNMVLA